MTMRNWKIHPANINDLFLYHYFTFVKDPNFSWNSKLCFRIFVIFSWAISRLPSSSALRLFCVLDFSSSDVTICDSLASCMYKKIKRHEIKIRINVAEFKVSLSQWVKIQIQKSAKCYLKKISEWKIKGFWPMRKFSNYQLHNFSLFNQMCCLCTAAK